MSVAIATKKWTLEELHSLPDDGNKYELIHGELFVTPPPLYEHERLAAKLTRLLDPYVALHHLGYVFHPRAVLRVRGSEVEPDLMVVPATHKGAVDWDTAPVPRLVVEILSPATRRRDHEHKRQFYLELGVAEYWIVDAEARAIRQIRPGAADVLARELLRWTPPGIGDSFHLQIPQLFE